MAETKIALQNTDRLDWCVRLVGTAVGFASFGLGGLVFAFFVVPWIWLRHRNAQDRSIVLRRAISSAFLLHVNTLRRFGVLSYRINEPQRLGREDFGGQLLVANHPTLLDVVFLVAFVDNAVCVVKDALFHNFFIGFVIRMAGYVSNRDPDAMIGACANALNRGDTVIIFPEGTRSTPGQKSRMQRGAAYVALHSGTMPTPVNISCVPSSLTKGLPWYSIPKSKMVFEFIVGQPIPIAELQDLERGLAARSLNRKIDEQIFREVNGVRHEFNE